MGQSWANVVVHLDPVWVAVRKGFAEEMEVVHRDWAALVQVDLVDCRDRLVVIEADHSVVELEVDTDSEEVKQEHKDFLDLADRDLAGVQENFEDYEHRASVVEVHLDSLDLLVAVGRY